MIVTSVLSNKPRRDGALVQSPKMIDKKSNDDDEFKRKPTDY